MAFESKITVLGKTSTGIVCAQIQFNCYDINNGTAGVKLF